MIRHCVLFLLISANCLAQDSLLFPKVIPVHAIKFSPFHLVNFYPTVQVAYEHRIEENVSVQFDVGYVVRNEGWVDPEFRDKRGFKVKVESRFYFSPNPSGTRASYIAPEIYFNAVDFDRTDSRVECYDLDCQITYTRTYYYKVRYREPGFGCKVGFVRYFGDFIIDLNAGLAIRFVDYKKPLLPREFNQPEEGVFFDIPNERKRIGRTPLLGIRFGYRFQ
jgi:hypothetical protein